MSAYTPIRDAVLSDGLRGLGLEWGSEIGLEFWLRFEIKSVVCLGDEQMGLLLF